MEGPSAKLVLGLLAALGINAWVCWYFFRRISGHILLTLVAIFYLLQVFWFFICVIVSGATALSNYIQSVANFNETPFRVSLGLTITPAISLAVARLLSTRGAKPSNLLETLNAQRVPSFEIMLCIFATGTLLYFLASQMATSLLEARYLAAFLAYSHYSFWMAPVLIGLCWRRYRRPLVVFACSAIPAGMMALAGGSRYLLFLPAAYLACGIWWTLGGKQKVLTAGVGVLLALPVFHFSGVIETVRKDGSRDIERELLARLSEVLQMGLDATQSGSISDGVSKGLGRMVMWCNVAALYYSPEQVSFRGFGDFWEEIRFINRSTLFVDDARDFLDQMVDADYGMGTARLYGFSISAGGTVPVPILADGWSRAGLMGAVAYSVVSCLCWGLAEIFIRRKFLNQPQLALALITILASSAYERMGTYGLVYNLRYLAMQTFLWVGLALALAGFSGYLQITSIGSRRRINGGTASVDQR